MQILLMHCLCGSYWECENVLFLTLQWYEQQRHSSTPYTGLPTITSVHFVTSFIAENAPWTQYAFTFLNIACEELSEEITFFD